MSVSPYLFFSGDCAAAFTRYQEVFGGELQLMTHADLPEGAEPMPGAEPHHVMHASLAVGDGMLMGSDDPTGDGGPKVGVAVAYTAPDERVANQLFDALADGGEVTMPFAATFWSRGFGACNDRFGVAWMVDTAGEP
ncbi:MAG: VOC family protein [Acidimicrobiia bacterium]|nr:VOC family protein [Acidimicrobiia bacterium]